MDKLLSLYSFFKTDKRKERFDIILEPLQAITQLALMAFCPYGSKLTISHNLLYIQTANWGQGLLRSFNNDKRDDLFFLFNSIIRFNKFYGYLKVGDHSNKNDKLMYDLLIRLGKKGIDNILQTYSNVDEPSLLHTLQMYKTLLDNPNLICDNAGASGAGASGAGASGAGASGAGASGAGASGAGESNKKNIDDLFIKIREIYTINDRNIIFNILTLIEKRPEYYEYYILALNNAMEPVNVQIKKWINDNIVY